jgi:hypothetical protein
MAYSEAKLKRMAAALLQTILNAKRNRQMLTYTHFVVASFKHILISPPTFIVQ